MATRQYKITFTHGKDGWLASILTVPGCHATGDTQEEARAKVKEALLYFFDDVDVDFIEEVR